MQEYIKRLPEDVVRLIALIREAAQQEGIRAYLIGGFVRDLLLGVKNLDLDVAVEGDGIVFAQILAASFSAKVILHRRFGTATLTFKPHFKIDITSTRKEIYPHPGSLPVVSNGTLEDDLRRRDFTINALAIAITGEGFGTLKDIGQGKEDLQKKRIRILHELSFIDDPTRILRAVRFQQRYGFSIEPKTLRLLKEALRQKMLERVQPQRLRDELILMLKEESPALQMKRLEELGGLGFISKTLRVTLTTRRLLHEAKMQIAWFMRAHHHRRHVESWLVYFMALVDQLDSHEVRSVCARFVFRKGEEKRIVGFKKLKASSFRLLSSRTITPRRAFSMLEHLSYETILLLKAKYRQKAFQRTIEQFLDIHDKARSSLSGHDLVGLGVRPGPCYQKIFRRLLHARLDGRVSSKEEELAFAKKIAAAWTKAHDKGRMCR